MPIVVDPTFVPPPPPSSVSSSDGVLTATADVANAGVLLKADFSAVGAAPTFVRFERTDGTLVRSGNTARATGGVAYAYDHEGDLGEPVSWRAVPVDRDGTDGTPSAVVALTLPAPADPSDGWLKSTVNPDASIMARLALAEENGRGLRVTLDEVTGSEYPVAAWDVPTALSVVVTIRTDTRAEYEAVVALIKEGPLLLQARDETGLPSNLHVLAVGQLRAERLAETGLGWKARHWSLALQCIARPDTQGVPLRIPGRTNAAQLEGYPTCAALLSQVATCGQLIEG